MNLEAIPKKEKWLPGCVSGDVVTAIAMTEPGAGSGFGGAFYDGGERW